MFVSAPIPQICVALSIYFNDRIDSQICIDKMEEISTTQIDTGSKEMDEKLASFIKRFDKEKTLIFYVSSFVSYYFKIMGDEELSMLFSKLMNENSERASNLHPYDAGYMTGIFSTCIIADNKLNVKLDVPKDIEEAIKYIEKHDFIVHLEKNVK